MNRFLSSEEIQEPIESDKKPFLSSPTKIILLIVVTVATTCGVLLNLYVGEHAIPELENPHFSDSQIEQQLDELIAPSIPDLKKENAKLEEPISGKPKLAKKKKTVLKTISDASELVTIGSSIPELHYEWQPGHYQRYQYQVVATPTDKSIAFGGVCRLLSGPKWEELTNAKISAKKPTLDLNDVNSQEKNISRVEIAKEDLDQYAGTAFVVTNDGYLATCAHVIKDAHFIEATLNGKKYEATTKSINHNNDLAIIKIEADNLKAIPHRDSDSVRLGEDIRVIGYPLSELLNSRLAVTRGTISGIKAEEEGGEFQIDAPVNQGNSGGPVVDERGAFLGIASSIISGPSVSNIAFAVPSNSMMDLIRGRGLKSDADLLPYGTSGPDLIESVSESIAYVRVWAAKENKPTNKINAYCKQNVQAVPSVGIAWNKSEVETNFACKLSQLGTISNYESDLRVPFLWVHPLELIIEPYENKESEFWTRSYETVLAIPQPNRHSRSVNSVFALRNTSRGFHGGFARPAFSPFDKEPTSQFKAEVKSTYKVTKRDDASKTIYAQTYMEANRTDGSPGFTMAGHKVTIFDLENHMPENTIGRYVCEWWHDGEKKEFPIEYSFSRIKPNPNDISSFRKKTEKLIRKQIQEEEISYKEANTNQNRLLDACLTRIRKSLDNDKPVLDELRTLQRYPTNISKRDEVIELAKEIIDRGNQEETRQSFKAMSNLVTKEHTSYLVDQLKSAKRTDHFLIANILDLIEETSDIEAADEVISLFIDKNHSYAYEAKSVLIAMGPPIEDEIIQLLKDDVKRDYVTFSILGKIGSKKSEEYLAKLILDETISDKHSVLMAIEDIQDRRARKLAQNKRKPINRIKDTDSKKDPGENPYFSKAVKAISFLNDKMEGVSVQGRNTNIGASLETLGDMPPIEELRASAIDALEKYLDVKRTPSHTLKAIIAMGVWGNESHSDRLIEILKHAKSSKAKLTIFESLSKIGDENANSQLIPYLLDPNYGYKAAKAFRKLSVTDEKKLIAYLNHPDIYLRTRVIAALGHAGSELSRKALKSELSKEGDTITLDEIVRSQARLNVRLDK